MKVGTVYSLERAGERLGTLTVADAEMFAIHCTFMSTPAFDSYRALFDEDAEIADRLTEVDSPDLLAQAEATLDRILALGLTIRREGGGMHRQALISIEGDHAEFRPLTPEEDPL